MTPQDQQRAPEQVALVVEDGHGVGQARRFISDHLGRWGLTELADDAQTITSELLTNALLHVGPPAEVVLRLAPPRARLEVHDHSPVPPIRQYGSTETMTGRGLYLVEGLASQWGVTSEPSGKAIWAELEAGVATDAPEQDVEALIAMWAPDEPETPAPPQEEVFTVSLGDVPTDLLLSAKSHVDNLVREFTLAASGAHTGATAQVPPHIAELIEAVVNRFSEARQSMKRQAIAAANAGEDHVALQLTLPISAASAGEAYLRALDEADGYCRAARLLTLESPPRHRVFRRWYVGELINQLRRSAEDEPARPAQTFEQRLLDEIDKVAAAEQRSEQAARLYSLAVALARAVTREAVAEALLREGVEALGAAGGGVLIVKDERKVAVASTVGYDQDVVARLRSESPDAELPAADALRTGVSVWLESRAERDDRFPQLVGFEPGTVSMCAVPLEVGDRRLGALRFSFREARLFGSDERRFVEAMAAITAQALDRAVLSQSQRGENSR